MLSLGPVAGVAATSNFWPDVEHHRVLYSSLAFGAAVLGVLAAEGFGERYQRERRAVLVRQAFLPTWERLHDVDPEVRLNVMLCDMIWPKSKDRWSWPWVPRRGLRMTDPQGFDAETDTDLGLCLLPHQGVAGVALKTGDWAIGIRRWERGVPTSLIFTKDASPIERMERGMTNSQIKATQHICFVCSFPIRALGRSKDADDAGRVKPRGKVIGVLNVHSKSLDPYFDTNDPNPDNWRRTEFLGELMKPVLPDLATLAGFIYG